MPGNKASINLKSVNYLKRQRDRIRQRKGDRGKLSDGLIDTRQKRRLLLQTKKLARKQAKQERKASTMKDE